MYLVYLIHILPFNFLGTFHAIPCYRCQDYGYYQGPSGIFVLYIDSYEWQESNNFIVDKISYVNIYPPGNHKLVPIVGVGLKYNMEIMR